MLKQSLQFSFRDKFIFKAFLKKYQAKVYQFCYLLVNDRSVAEEITANVFLTIYEKGNIREINSYSLYQHLVLCVKDSLLVKRNKIISRLQSNTSIVNEAVCLLSTEDRIIIGLTHVCSVSAEDISLLMNIPKQEVKERLYQSREFLTDFLNEQERREQLELLS
ncbi:RNA polymerase sigma factor [Gracilibacillus massiliensis]|uniref:RNA polymerase sigma factor n=1 Tax=Gracilibacillus massiliensis TaxID=1564956 RepID=UPI00071CD503|nr:hypothetical protein [Gracilibacillus massiliensis]